MKKLQTICAATLLVLAFGIPALADDGIMGMGGGTTPPPPPPPLTTSSTAAVTTDTAVQSSDGSITTTIVQEAELYVVRGLVSLL